MYSLRLEHNTNEQYHRNDGYFSSTFVKNLMLKGVEKAVSDLHRKKEPTPAMQIGTLAHLLILENKTDFKVMKEGLSARTKEGKAWKQAQERKGFTIVSQETSDDIFFMRDAVEYDKTAREFLNAAKDREVSYYCDDVHGVKWKARYDASASELIVDLKTCSSIEAFERDFFSLGYDIQSDWYRLHDGTPRVFVFIAVEKVAPYRVRTYVRDTITTDFSDTLQILRNVNLNDFHAQKTALPAETINATLPVWQAELRDRNTQQSKQLLGLA